MSIAFRYPSPSIPYDDRTGAVLSFRDHALEAPILERVVFGLHRKPLLRRIHARPLRHGPTLEHAVELQSKVVVQPGRVMLLDHEREPPVGGWRGLFFATRLGSAAEISLLSVGHQAHEQHKS